jgi:hypothetical protein
MKSKKCVLDRCQITAAGDTDLSFSNLQIFWQPCVLHAVCRVTLRYHRLWVVTIMLLKNEIERLSGLYRVHLTNFIIRVQFPPCVLFQRWLLVIAYKH